MLLPETTPRDRAPDDAAPAARATARARPAPAGHGGAQRHARFVQRRRPLAAIPSAPSRTALHACSSRAPTCSTSAPSPPGPAAGSTAPAPPTWPPRRSSRGCCRSSTRCAPRTAAPLSVDTRKAAVARAALAAGADLVNDVSALGDPEMARRGRRGRLPAGPDAQPRRAARRCSRRSGTSDWSPRCATSSRAALARAERAGVDARADRARSRDRLRQDLRAQPRAAARASTRWRRSAGRWSSGPAARASSASLTGEPPARAARRQPRRRGLGGARAAPRCVRVHDVAETVQFLGVWRGGRARRTRREHRRVLPAPRLARSRRRPDRRDRDLQPAAADPRHARGAGPARHPVPRRLLLPGPLRRPGDPRDASSRTSSSSCRSPSWSSSSTRSGAPWRASAATPSGAWRRTSEGAAAFNEIVARRHHPRRAQDRRAHRHRAAGGAARLHRERRAARRRGLLRPADHGLHTRHAAPRRRGDRPGRSHRRRRLLPAADPNPELSKEFGTRHRAALGISEETDAVAVVVSEETGLISVAFEGQMIRDLDAKTLRNTPLQVPDHRPLPAGAPAARETGAAESGGPGRCGCWPWRWRSCCWFFIAVEEREGIAEKTVEAAITYSPPRGHVLLDPVQRARVRLRGRTSRIRNLNPFVVDVFVEVPAGRRGTVRPADPAGERDRCRRGSRWWRSSPNTIRLRLDREATEMLPVRARLVGEPAAGAVAREVQVVPDKVLVSGPRVAPARRRQPDAPPPSTSTATPSTSRRPRRCSAPIR